MRNNKVIIGIVLLIAILLVAVGYAAISATGLNISGNLSATADDENFKVKFTGTPAVSDDTKVDATIVDDLNATINVQGLTTRGDTASARYTVINESADLSAELTAEVKTNTNTNTEYFDVTYEIEEPDILKAGETTTILVTVELLKTPITNDVSTTIKVEVTADPMQPETTPIPPDISGGEGVSPNEIFDATGEVEDKLHIGDFVDYDAGKWTQEEIDAIQTGLKGEDTIQTANGSAELPTNHMQFGGFTAGSSRNGNATPYWDEFDYIKDAMTGRAITGWRVFDIDGDKITLISAGNPEDYYHAFGTDYGYQSEYILTGNVNSDWTSGGATAEKDYQKRDWSNYINTEQKATNAEVLTKRRLDSWYSKYTGVANANTYDDATFQKIYQEPYIKYQNMVDNFSHYWLSASYDFYGVFRVWPDCFYVEYEGDLASGVRVLVSLSSDVKLTSEKIGTKTLTGGNMDTDGGDQTYNVWGIK